MFATLALVVRERLLKAGQPLPVAFDLLVEERDRLRGLKEPKHEEAQDRFVAHGPSGAVSRSQCWASAIPFSVIA